MNRRLGALPMTFALGVAIVAWTPAIPAPQPSTSFLAGDAARGAIVFARCQACHTIKGSNHLVGPNLRTVVGRQVASIPGYKFSPALSALGGAWTPQRLDQFLTSPQSYAPGTRMAFAGLRNPTDKSDLIAFLRSLKDKRN